MDNEKKIKETDLNIEKNNFESDDPEEDWDGSDDTGIMGRIISHVSTCLEYLLQLWYGDRRIKRIKIYYEFCG